MKRKMIALFLIFAMLASLSPAVAADEMSATPTVEEILNEYHQKAFEAQTQGDTETASTWSRRSGSAKTLEQETVDTLTEAGYEAYNVTADNYETLQAELKTDFATMGLDPEGSYIVVVGEENKEGLLPSNVDPNPEQITPEFGDGAFSHTLNNTTYFLRYITVVAADDSRLRIESSYFIDNLNQFAPGVNDMTGTVFVGTMDGVTKFPFASLFNFFYDMFKNENYTVLNDQSVTLYAGTSWTRDIIQIWDNATQTWIAAQSSSTAHSSAWVVHLVYDTTQGKHNLCVHDPYSQVFYSALYDKHVPENVTNRIECAISAYTAGTVSHDKMDPIKFYFSSEDGAVNFNNGVGPLFTHSEPVY